MSSARCGLSDYTQNKQCKTQRKYVSAVCSDVTKTARYKDKSSGGKATGCKGKAKDFGLKAKTKV